MTNLQLLLSIGIPSILVVLSWISNNSRLADHEKRFDSIDKRFDSVDKRFESIDKRFDSIDKRFESMERRFEEMDRRFDSGISSQHKDALEIMRNMTAQHERVAVVEARQAS
jgi:DNA anti-recombination protein RmuC